MPVCIHNATIRLVRSGPQMAQNASFHFALPYAFWRSERYSPKFWETNPNNWNFGPMNRTNTRVSGRYDKPPLAARCCHVANDLTNFHRRQTNEQTDRQTGGHRHRVNLPLLRAGLITSADRHSKPRLTPHCRVLPPGEFNGIMSQPLPVYSESFMTKVVTGFH